MNRSNIAAALLFLPLFGCPPPESSDIQVDDDPVWTAFDASRQDWLVDLSEPIENCVGEVDTTHPAFHGCIDWHSHVHATWSLLALTRMTGDQHYTDVVEETLIVEDVALELDAMVNDTIDPSEIPYGYSWFLVLARERKAAGQDDLKPLAEVAANALEDHVNGLEGLQIGSAVVAPHYKNLSWELLNLYLWAEAEGDTARMDWVLDVTRRDVLTNESCELTDVRFYDKDFFPPCLHRARLLLTVLPEAERNAYIATIPEGFKVAVIEPEDAHQAGLNFSRSWGLWDLFQATGDIETRDNYIEVVDAHVNMPEYWRDNYQAHSHWVAQFGVYSLSLSYDVVP